MEKVLFIYEKFGIIYPLFIKTTPKQKAMTIFKKLNTNQNLCKHQLRLVLTKFAGVAQPGQRR